MIDEASGLLTPRGFLAMAKQQRHIAMRARRDVIFMIVRIAHFHVYAIHQPDVANDLIKLVGKVFKETLRDVDLLARLDEDRFVCMGVENEPCDLDAWADRLRGRFSAERSTSARIRIGTFRWRPTKKESLTDLIDAMTRKMPL